VLVRNSLWIWGVFGATSVTVFFLTPFLIGRLGAEGYGIWGVVVGLTGYLGLADLGVRPAVVHFVAKHDALHDDAGLNRFVNSAFAAFSLGGALVVVATLVVAALIPRLPDLPPEVAHEAVLAVLITGIEIGVTLPFNAYSAVLVGKQRFDVLGRIDLLVLVVRTGAVVLALSNGQGLVALAVANAGAGLLEIALKAWAGFRIAPSLRFAPRAADRPALGALLRYGGLAILVTIALQLTWQTDAFVIAAALSPALVTPFHPPAMLASYTRSLLWSGCRAIAPAAGALEAKGDAAGLARLLQRSTRSMLLLSGPILVYFVALGEPFLARWLGDAFDPSSVPVLTILALGVAAPIATHPFVQVHYGTNRMRSLALLYAAEGAANLALSVALVEPFGIAGVALGTAIPAAVVHLWVLPWRLCRPFGIRWGAFTVSTWAAPTAAGAITFLALRLLVAPSDRPGWAALAGCAALAVALFHALAAVLLRLARLAPAEPAGDVVPEAAR
jgi:O-antigen/teichoic acid export membrane protein